MRIQTLNEMLADLRVEARLSQNVAHGVHVIPGYKSLLRRIQEELYAAYDWPNLDVVASTMLSAGERYKEYPEVIDPEGIFSVHAADLDGKFRHLEHGIGVLELNYVDSDADERRSLVERWANYLSPVAETVNQNMFEVWPIPDRTVKVRFAGKRKLLPLVNDGDRCTLDGPLIVLHAAAEILAGQKGEDATLKLQKAQARMDFLRKRIKPRRSEPVNLSAPPAPPRLRRGIDYME